MQVALTKVWLVNVVTSEMLGANSGRSRPQAYGTGGEVRTYAGGRQRTVGKSGLHGSWQFELLQLSLTQVGVLRSWLEHGATVFARDHRGQSMYGTFFDLAIGEWLAPSAYTASVTLQRVDVVEGV